MLKFSLSIVKDIVGKKKKRRGSNSSYFFAGSFTRIASQVPYVVEIWNFADDRPGTGGCIR